MQAGQARSQPNLGLGERSHVVVCGPCFSTAAASPLHHCRSHVASMAQVGKGGVFLRNTKCVFLTIFLLLRNRAG